MNNQLFHSDEHIGHFVQSAFSGLDRGNLILGVLSLWAIPAISPLIFQKSKGRQRLPARLMRKPDDSFSIDLEALTVFALYCLNVLIAEMLWLMRIELSSLIFYWESVP